ncbi:hypothetical protein GGI15_001448 [Coemansia interrupta]|uniref:Uncharacterized protein n=1 Tax=Coemansia interrupta TaxID=1126814 RepID=A0A9W8HJR7_9FUNG|nr:hypothetical protein GGI15_001448 [Coemansia interrupta]
MDSPGKMSQESRRQRLEELSVLEDELSNLRATASVYAQRTKTPLFFQTTQAKALASVRHEIKQLSTPSTDLE